MKDGKGLRICPRRGMTGVVVWDGKLLYAVGGGRWDNNGKTNAALKSVECLDLKNLDARVEGTGGSVRGEALAGRCCTLYDAYGWGKHRIEFAASIAA